jgi:hypothetical protein
MQSQQHEQQEVCSEAGMRLAGEYIDFCICRIKTYCENRVKSRCRFLS